MKEHVEATQFCTHFCTLPFCALVNKIYPLSCKQRLTNDATMKMFLLENLHCTKQQWNNIATECDLKYIAL